MEALLFAVCESINTSGQTLDLIDIYDAVAADGEPTVKNLTGFLKARFNQDDEGRKFVIEARVVNADGIVIVSDKCLVEVPEGKIPEGKHMIFHHTIELGSVNFPKLGEYSFDLLVSGETIRQWPISVVPRMREK